MMPAPHFGSQPLRFETRFGQLEARDPNIIEFLEGIPGFEGCRRWVLIGSDELAPLRCLLAFDAPEPSFLTVDPVVIVPEYRYRINPATQALLGAQTGDVLLWLAIVTLTENREGTANLKAPIVINTSRMRGCQTILDEPAYTVDHSI
jgi:flagellar assembly factor FliW